MRRVHRLLLRLSLVPLLFGSGCAGYHLGPVKPTFMKEVRTLSVPAFKNNTLMPRTEVLVADTLIKQLQQDGTYEIVPNDRADAIIEGSVTNIQRTPSRSLRGNVLATSEYTLTVTLEVRVTKRDTGALITRRLFNGTTSFFVGQDVNQDERQALPLAVQDAAQSVVTALSEGW